MKSITSIKNLKGKKVLLRTDFNVPIGTNNIVDHEEAWRIDKGIETINYLRKKGAKVIVISHIGRSSKDSLLGVSNFLSKLIPITFIPGHTQDFVHEKISKMKDGDVVMLENLRCDEGEEKNSPSFARGLSRLADIYVNDAFSVSHRRHASIVGLPKYLKSYAGLNLVNEIRNLGIVFKKPKKPFLFILGGAKFETKLPLVKKYLSKVDYIFVGGALQNNFFKSAGFDVGDSVIDNKKYNLGTIIKNKKLLLAEDLIVIRKEKTQIVNLKEIEKHDVIVDIGPKTIKILIDKINSSKTVLWNGPLGFYEKGFIDSTSEVIKALSANRNNTTSIVGGGDTVVTIKKLKLENKLSFVSTGGGAMLDFLENGRLPGIDALK